MHKVHPSKYLLLFCLTAIITLGMASPSAGQTFSDTFDRANNTNLGPDWNETGLNLEIFSNQIRNADTGIKAAQFTKSIGPDQNVSVDCMVTASSNSCALWPGGPVQPISTMRGSMLD